MDSALKELLFTHNEVIYVCFVTNELSDGIGWRSSAENYSISQ